MASLGMSNAFEFDRETISDEITQTKSGNYALGYVNNNKRFIVQYVGRSDGDLRSRLCEHLGENYSHFKYRYASSPKNAFEIECNNFHDFGGDRDKLKNKYHPDRPEGASWKCPCCDIFDD
jgi:hypothetical protein